MSYVSEIKVNKHPDKVYSDFLLNRGEFSVVGRILQEEKSKMRVERLRNRGRGQ